MGKIKLLKKIAALILALAVGMSLCGCGSEKILQVSDRMFVHLMGIEENGGTCLLTLQIFDIGGNDTSAEEYTVLSGSGRTFTEARDMIERERGKKLFFGQCEAVVCDSDVICSPGLLSTLMKEQVPKGCRMFYCDQPSIYAARTDENGELYESGRADRFADVLKFYEAEGIITPVSLLDTFTASVSGRKLLIPRIKDTICGSAAADTTSRSMTVLSTAESAAANLMRNVKNIRLSAEMGYGSGALTVYSLDHSAYTRIDGDKLICTVTFDAVCSADEIPWGTDREELVPYSAKALEDVIMGICARGYENKYADLLLDSETAEIIMSSELPVEFRAECRSISFR
ncbi:MAG: hypothetical protein ACI4JJ_06115 [Huintestinicola sp.]